MGCVCGGGCECAHMHAHLRQEAYSQRQDDTNTYPLYIALCEVLQEW